MAWGKAGSKTGSGSSIDITDLTSNKFNQVMSHSFLDGQVDFRMRLGNGSFDSGVSYSDRLSNNGGADVTSLVNQTDIHVMNTSSGYDSFFVVMYMINIATEEKLDIFNSVATPATGAGSAPERMEGVNKWKNISDQFDYIKIMDESGTEIDTNSNLSVLGSDITPAAAIPFPTNVQEGSRAEITDTRKMYNFDDVTGSNVSLTGLKAYYNFDQTSGNLINKAESSGSTDSLGTSADGTNSNVSQTNTGILGNSYLYNKTSSYTQLGSSLSQFNFCHTPNFKWTFNAWYKLTTDPTSGSHQRMFGDYATSGYRTGVDLGFNNLTVSGTIQSVSTGSIITGSTGNIVPADTDWHMITWRFDHTLSSANAKIRIDNGSDSTLNKTASTPSSGNHQHEGHIGSTGIENYNFGGLLDEISIWDRVLTDAELTALYNTGAGKRIGNSWKEIGS